MRIGKKSVYQGNTSETSYVVSGTQILSETKGSNTIYYIYDDKGLPIGLVYNGVTYTYRKNVQGDIIAILNSAGNEVVNYTYNAWGKVISITGTETFTVGVDNPFRYRGYYYDTEMGYYYLNSRYYDPVTGRFLNADSFVSTGQGLLGTNMFAYCGNNPVNMVDYNGDWGVTAFYLTKTEFSNFRSDFTAKYQHTFRDKMISAAINVGVTVASSKLKNPYISGALTAYTVITPFITTSADEKHYFSTWLNTFIMDDNDCFKISLLFGSNNNQVKIEIYHEVVVNMQNQIMGHTFEYKYYNRVFHQTGIYEFVYNGSYEEMIEMLSPHAYESCYYKVPTGYKF